MKANRRGGRLDRYGVAFLVALLVGSSGGWPDVPSPARASRISAPSAAPSAAEAPVARLATGDGLGMSLEGDGRIAGVDLGGRTVTALSGGGGWSVRTAGTEPNLLTNAGFETDRDLDGVPDGWSRTGSIRRPQLVTGNRHGGARAVRLDNPDGNGSGALMRVVGLAASTDYTLAAWMRSDDILPSATTTSRSSFRLRVSQLSSRGSVVQMNETAAYSDTAPWHRRFFGFRTAPGVTAVRITVLFAGGSGSGWIDDLELRRLFARSWTPVRGTGTVTSTRTGAQQNAPVSGQPLRLSASYTRAANHIRIDGSIERTQSGTSAHQVAFTLPVDARGWRWADDPRSARTITAGRYTRVTTRTLQSTSRYPLAVIGPRTGRSLGMAMDLADPRIARLEYDTAAGLRIVFDLGVSSAATNLGPRATFSVIVFTADAAWSFRAAVKKYYAILPGAFVRRTEPAREGAWFFRARIDLIGDDARAYGLGWNVSALGKAPKQSWDTWGLELLPWANEQGLYAGAYTHLWAHYDLRPADGSIPSYDAAMTHLRAEAALTGTSDAIVRRREEAQAALRSTSRDNNGRLLYERFAEFLAYWQNDEDLGPGDWTRATTKHQIQRALDEAKGIGADLDLIHMDSTSGSKRWGAADDYARSHWAAATMPLTFSYESGMVVQRGVLTMVPRIQQLSDDLHRQGRLLTANSNAGEGGPAGYFGTDAIDAFGIEGGLHTKARSYEDTTVDQFAMLKRTIANQRLVSTFDYDLDDSLMTPAETRLRLQHNLFYGFHAMGPVNDVLLGDDRRAIFLRHAPLIRELTMAGWEPVTYARSSDPVVWLERFGRAADDDLSFTLRNESAVSRDVTITIQLNAMGGTTTRATARERLIGQTLAVTLADAGRTARFSVRVPAGRTRMVTLDLGTPG